jgi:hypothetical protein
MRGVPPLLVILSLTASAPAADPKPFPGKAGDYHGFTRHDFRVDDAHVIVVESAKPLAGRPWAWRGEFYGAFDNADVELLKAGWHLAYMGVPDLFGGPRSGGVNEPCIFRPDWQRTAPPIINHTAATRVEKELREGGRRQRAARQQRQRAGTPSINDILCAIGDLDGERKPFGGSGGHSQWRWGGARA